MSVKRNKYIQRIKYYAQGKAYIHMETPLCFDV